MFFFGKGGVFFGVFGGFFCVFGVFGIFGVFWSISCFALRACFLFGVLGVWFGVFCVLVGVLCVFWPTLGVIGVFVIGILYLLHLEFELVYLMFSSLKMCRFMFIFSE